jgi:hypothetical protein
LNLGDRRQNILDRHFPIFRHRSPQPRLGCALIRATHLG